MATRFIMKEVHIGQMIQEELNRQGRTVNWFAREIYCEKSNVYKMFKRRSIDMAQLMKISEVLDHNFLVDCYEEPLWFSSDLVNNVSGCKFSNLQPFLYVIWLELCIFAHS